MKQNFLYRTSTMANWNALFSTSIDILKSHGMEIEDARKLARYSLNKFDTEQKLMNGTMNEGSRSLNDNCNEDLTVVCDSGSKFRTINGRCNNLKNRLWGSCGVQLRRSLPGIPKVFSIPTTPNENKKAVSGLSLSDINFFGLENGAQCNCFNEKCVNSTPIVRPDPRTISSRFFTKTSRASGTITHTTAVLVNS